jgi:hypothetical protein
MQEISIEQSNAAQDIKPAQQLATIKKLLTATELGIS